MSSLVAKFILAVLVNLGLALIAVHAVLDAAQFQALAQTVTAITP